MNTVELLAKQTDDAYSWTNKLLHSIPPQKWDVLPEVAGTTVTWQAGHLIMSHYFHSVMVIVGHLKDVFPVVPLQQYDKLFTNADPKDSIGVTKPQELHDKLMFIQKRSIEVISSLTDADLEQPLVPSPTPHPIAKTKYEALDWNIKHTMYHCGQIGMIKRIVDQRYDFGLRKGS
ncbi:DinB family protein [Niastella sp. OAS944]|uniref:DinB family protein n=1 Tax=Niastella sp. OAS944 TaxID=2664089 RepID=UPI003483C758|nr:hypothetical protein [Chitinophagaceae bacterium OAS944]